MPVLPPPALTCALYGLSLLLTLPTGKNVTVFIKSFILKGFMEDEILLNVEINES